MTSFDKLRKQMVSEQVFRRGITDKRVLNAMESVPRHLFIEDNRSELAYYDGPLPIGYNQTISQPYIVAFMTDVLNVQPNDRVLEIGTGCGYQAAVLSLLSKEIISLEFVPELAKSAHKRLSDLCYNTVEVHQADGTKGWKDKAPYDCIIGTAAPPTIPEPLIEQLANKGRMILPIGGSVFDQSLFIITKNAQGKVKKKRSLPVRFVPMVSK